MTEYRHFNAMINSFNNFQKLSLLIILFSTKNFFSQYISLFKSLFLISASSQSPFQGVVFTAEYHKMVKINNQSKVSQHQHFWHLGLGHSLSWALSRAHCRMFSIPSLYSLNTRSPSTPLWQPKVAPDIARLPFGGVGGRRWGQWAQASLVENHWTRFMFKSQIYNVVLKKKLLQKDVCNNMPVYMIFNVQRSSKMLMGHS